MYYIIKIKREKKGDMEITKGKRIDRTLRKRQSRHGGFVVVSFFDLNTENSQNRIF
jgi:hypothetical protein